MQRAYHLPQVVEVPIAEGYLAVGAGIVDGKPAVLGTGQANAQLPDAHPAQGIGGEGLFGRFPIAKQGNPAHGGGFVSPKGGNLPNQNPLSSD